MAKKQGRNRAAAMMLAAIARVMTIGQMGPGAEGNENGRWKRPDWIQAE